MRKLLIVIIILTYFGANSQTIKTYTTNGSFIVPSGVTSITVEVWGAGGAGGSAVGNQSPAYRGMGGGGGGGAYQKSTIIVTPTQTINYIVAQSTGNNTSTSPLDGGNSEFGGVIGNGGKGGQCVNAATNGNHVGGLGGNGGTGTYNGGIGGSRTLYDGVVSGRVGAGGGGGAGSMGSGTDASNDQTNGSPGLGGSGGGGNGDSGQNSTGDGAKGLIIGGGGSGAWAAASATFRNGGSGERGQITITYSISMPVEFTIFNINRNILSFSTASETNNDYFTIERAADDMSFEAIGMITGAVNSNTEIRYQFTDDKPMKGMNYYRIKQTDFDGKFTYSAVKSVRYDRGERISISPQMTEGRLHLTTTCEDYTISIINSAGQEMKRFPSMSLSQSISIDELQTGLYFLRATHGAEIETLKIIKI